MKKLIIALLLVANVASAQLYSAFKYANYKGTNKTDTTLRTMISVLGTRHCTILLDGGGWNIATNVTFPTNIGLRILAGSFLNCTNPLSIVELGTNAPFEAPAMQVFYGTGTVTGQPAFIYRYPEWGNVTNFNIGSGRLVSDNVGGYITTNSITNLYSENNGPLVTTNSISDDLTNSYSENNGPIITTNSVTNLYAENSGPILTTNQFQALVITNYYFRATKTTNQIILGSFPTMREVTWEEARLNVGNGFVVATNGFIVPDTGDYVFPVCIHWDNDLEATNEYYWVQFTSNGNSVATMAAFLEATPSLSATPHQAVTFGPYRLTNGCRITIEAGHSEAVSHNTNTIQSTSWFSGFRLVNGVNP